MDEVFSLPDTWRADLREALAMFSKVANLQADLNIWRDFLAEGESSGQLSLPRYTELAATAERAMATLAALEPPLGGPAWPKPLVQRLQVLQDQQQYLKPEA
jgi:hypothetical protein